MQARRQPLRLLAWLVLALLAQPTLGEGEKVKLKRWADGPIRYIIRPDEAKMFKKLRNDNDRALFIERFWARRDPTPETLTNEYRQTFWERVSQANAKFLDSSRPGWITDRGKIYVLYGPPTKSEDHLHLDTGASTTAGRGLIRWHYEGRPEQREDLDAVTVVPFVRDSTGEWRLSTDPRLASIFFNESTVRNRHWDPYYDHWSDPRRSELSVMLDLGKLQEVPPHARVLMHRVETIESYRTEPVKALVSRYWHPERDASVAVVTADVSHVAAEARPAVIARFKYADPAREPRMLGEDSFKFVERGGQRLAQARLVLEPGEYQVTVLVANPLTAATGLFKTEFRAPSAPERLRLSDVVWTQELAPVRYVGLASHDEPFVVGPYEVVPKLDDRFLAGDTLTLFYEIYGAEGPYRIAYQLLGRETDGSWVSLGQPSVDTRRGAAQAWELPTSAGWPPGEYRIRIEVEDEKNRLVTIQAPFTLEESGAS